MAAGEVTGGGHAAGGMGARDAARVVDGLTRVPGKNTVVVRVGDSSYEIAGTAAEALELAEGLAVTSRLLGQLEAAAARRAAAAQALRYLRGRPRTELEVRRHLEAKGHGAGAVSAVLRELRAGGHVDDARFAEWFVQARLAHRPTGLARLVSEMRQRGVPRQLAETAAESAMAGQDEVSLAFEAARKRLPSMRGLKREKALRRLSQFLSARGFSQETVRTVCLGLLGEEASEENGGSE